MKKIAIDIDFVLRDWIIALENAYIKQVGDFEGEITDLEDLWKHFNFPEYIELEKETDDSELMEIVTAVDEKSDWKPNYNYFNQFMSDNVLEIFGHAKESVPNAVTHVNQLQLEDSKIEITLFSKSKGKAIPATYFFLSKTGCEIKNIKFILTEYELLDMDVIVTSNLEFKKVFHKEKVIFITSEINQLGNLEDYKKFDSIKQILSFT